MKLPFIPEDAPFTGDQKSWLAGFLAGMQSAKTMTGSQLGTAANTAASTAPLVNILYGTQTGNAEGLAMDAAAAVHPFAQAGILAQDLGLGLNAGHDLSLDNLKYFAENVPSLMEVSIGHALVSDALYYGLENIVQMYLARLNG